MTQEQRLDRIMDRLNEYNSIDAVSIASGEAFRRLAWAMGVDPEVRQLFTDYCNVEKERQDYEKGW